MWLGIVIAMVVALLVGVMNGVVVVVFKIDSLIGTLATGFLIQSLVLWRTGSRTVTGPQLLGSFQDIALNKWLWDLTMPVLYALVMALGIWYLQDHTATGRRIYATGFNKDATRLASVRTDRLQFGCLLASATLAGVTGIVLASNIGSGAPTAGNSFLLPAFAAVFLGDSDRTLERDLKHDFPAADIERNDDVLAPRVKGVLARLYGRKPTALDAPDVPLDILGTAFQWKVWRALTEIPEGTTLTYGEIASKLGKPGAARAVGRACATNPVAIVVPCHRAVGTRGALTGYRWGVERKRRLLEAEKKRAAG